MKKLSFLEDTQNNRNEQGKGHGEAQTKPNEQ